MMPQCKAKSKRSGEQCKLPAMKGKEVCKFHGGKSLAGKDSATFKTGKYSKFLPDRLATKYEEALADQDRISLHNEIGLVDAQLMTQLEQWQETGMNRDGWTSARRLLADGDLIALGRLLDEGQDDPSIWKFTGELIESRRRLVETERKKLESDERSVNIEQLMMFMGVILDVIRRRVSDVEAQRAIAQDLRALMSKGSVQ